MDLTNPHSYKILPDRSVVFVDYHASPTIEGGQQFLSQILEDPDYRPGMGILLDRRYVRAGSTHYVQSMVRLVDRHRKRMGSPRWAILVSDTESFGMGRMAEQLTDYQGSIRVFRSLPDAEEWLSEANNMPVAVEDKKRPHEGTNPLNGHGGAVGFGWCGIEVWLLSSLLHPWLEAAHILG